MSRFDVSCRFAVVRRAPHNCAQSACAASAVLLLNTLLNPKYVKGVSVLYLHTYLGRVTFIKQTHFATNNQILNSSRETNIHKHTYTPYKYRIVW